MKDFCVILMFDKKFLSKSHTTIQQIRGVGLYKGDIVCIIADNLRGSEHLLYKDENIIIKEFKQYSTDAILNDPRKHPARLKDKETAKVCFPMKAKMIHYHKLYCFHPWFKENYKKCFYIDTGTQIFKPLDKIINLDCTDKLIAHSNAFPKYESGDKMYTQFDGVIYPDLYKELSKRFDLNVDHFQATVMLFDTSIIENDTFDTLMELSYRYVNSKTNDQAILNLYYGCMKHKWEQMRIKDEETYYYDFFERGDLHKTDYIMVKYPQT